MIVFHNLMYSPCKLLTDILYKEGVYVVYTMYIWIKHFKMFIAIKLYSCNRENMN